GAQLSRAHLNDAVLTQSRFATASLWGAELRRANLLGVSFQMAELKLARLDSAELGDASFRGADLSYASIKDVRSWLWVRDYRMAYIGKLESAPPGFKRWAIRLGAFDGDYNLWR